MLKAYCLKPKTKKKYMETNQWIIFFLLIQVIHFLGTWKLYIAAGRKAWEAAIPIYNAIILMKIIQRPTWWVFILFLPIVNLIMFPVIWVETLKTFGKKTQKDAVLGVFTAGFYIYYVNYTQKIIYDNKREFKETFFSSILYAIVFASTVHAYIIQPFIIPTSSLEKTLLVGDFLLVSKFHYGARPPMTTVAAPMVHDTIPLLKTKSYLKFPQAPYLRLPALQQIKNNDIVVFNWPVDTVRFFRDKNSFGIRKPIDKKSNYVKRCVGISGDSLQIKDGVVYINNKILPLHDRAKPQQSYKIITDGSNIDFTSILYDLNVTDPAGFIAKDTFFSVALTEEGVARLKSFPGVKDVIKNQNKADKTVFPYTQNWSIDNFGPIYIPKAGVTVDLTLETLPFYKEIIREYEKNKLEIKNNQIYINEKPSTTYTFKQNYYWMMGDNRHNSEDSRIWGYVPQDHIVGKPVFIWMSLDSTKQGIMNKIRWERLFTTVGGDGKPVSYFRYFLIFLALYFAWDYYRTKKEKNKIEE